MLLMQKASAGEHTANAGRVRHVYALTYAIYALACAQRVKEVVSLKWGRMCMNLCLCTCTFTTSAVEPVTEPYYSPGMHAAAEVTYDKIVSKPPLTNMSAK